MSQHLTLSPSEAADRLAIRELVEAYAHCADRRDAKGQMALFTADTHFVVYLNAKDGSVKFSVSGPLSQKERQHGHEKTRIRGREEADEAGGSDRGRGRAGEAVRGVAGSSDA